MTKSEFENELGKLTDTVHILLHHGASMSVKKEVIDLGAGGFTAGEHTRWGGINYSAVSSISSVPYVFIDSSCILGSDPEFFYVKEGEVVPSTLVVPEHGNLVKQDGFQGELNPETHSCRQVAGSNIAEALEEAYQYAVMNGSKISLDVGHVISDNVWKSVPSSLKRFGCNPTLNVHENKFKRVTGLREKFRAAGGHIHLGLSSEYRKKEIYETLVKLFDITTGSVFVLIDRDENNKRRRENYGRAGEYRAKPYGLEYRVLSNIWLKHYILWSMATAFLRNAIGIYDKGLAEELISKFDMKNVRDAINNNDKDLALENLLTYAKFIKEKNITSRTGLSIGNIDAFIKWMTEKDPISSIRCANIEETMESWREKAYEGSDGFEIFIERYKNNNT